MQLLSYNVPEKEINPLKDKVIKKMKSLGYDAKEVSIKPHITIAQIKDETPIEELLKLQKDGKKFKSEFKYNGISVFPGSGNLDYVSLDLSANQSFKNYVKHIADNEDVAVVTFPGGFKPHISICTIPKGSITPEDEKKLFDLEDGTIIPTKIQVWGKEKKVIKEIVAEIMRTTCTNHLSTLLDLERSVYSNSEPTHTLNLNKESIIKKVISKLNAATS